MCSSGSCTNPQHITVDVNCIMDRYFEMRSELCWLRYDEVSDRSSKFKTATQVTSKLNSNPIPDLSSSIIMQKISWAVFWGLAVVFLVMNLTKGCNKNSDFTISSSIIDQTTRNK